ncbi:hypothetical protein ACI65C_011315 [Semiaphis heraclei]
MSRRYNGECRVDCGRYVSISADSVAERARIVAAASMIRPAAVVLSAGGVRAAAAAAAAVCCGVSCTPSREIKCLLFSNSLYTQCGHASVVQLPYVNSTKCKVPLIVNMGGNWKQSI